VMRSLVEHIYEMVQKQGNDYKNEYRNWQKLKKMMWFM
jgi:hypothetical protein